MYIQTGEQELINSICLQQPYGKNWVSFFNRQTKEIQVFDPINYHIVQFINIGQNIRSYQFSYDNSFLILNLDDKCIMVQDLIKDVKTYYNYVDSWKTYNNEVWIEQKNKLLIIKDNTIVSSTQDRISNYNFGFKFRVQSNTQCHKFINIGKTRIKYFLSAKNIDMRNFSSNINFWGGYNSIQDEQFLRLLNKLYKQIKLIRKIKQNLNLEIQQKIIRKDFITLLFEIENGGIYFKLINASNAKIKRSWCGFLLKNFVITNDLKILIYQEDQKYKICSYTL